MHVRSDFRRFHEAAKLFALVEHFSIIDIGHVDETDVCMMPVYLVAHPVQHGRHAAPDQHKRFSLKIIPCQPFFPCAGTFLIGFFAVATQILVVFATGLAADSERGRVLGILACGIFLGIALSRPASSLIAGAAGWRTLYVGAGALMLAFGAALLRFLPAVRPAGLRVRYGVMLRGMGGLLFSVPRMVPRVMLSAGGFFSFSMFWSAAPIHLLDNLHFSHEGMALFALAGLITPPCVLLAGRLLDRGWSFRLLGMVTALAASAWLLTLWLPSFAVFFVVAALLIDPAGSVSTLTIQRSVLASPPESRGRLRADYL